MEKNKNKKIWFVNISKYHHRTMGLMTPQKNYLLSFGYITFFWEQINWFRVENITEVMTPFPTRVLEDGVIPLRFTLNFEKLTYIPQLTFHVQSRGFSELVKEYPARCF